MVITHEDDAWHMELRDPLGPITASRRDGMRIDIPEAGLVIKLAGDVALRDARNATVRSWRLVDAPDVTDLALEGRRLRQLVARDHVGQLTLEFADGSSLVAESEPEIEGWEVVGVRGHFDGLRLVCMPGGEIAYWSPASAKQGEA